MARFTVHGTDQLEVAIRTQLHEISCDVIRTLSERCIECLVLGGGYGRGEGGVLLAPDGRERPHNDYDLLLVHRLSTQFSLLRKPAPLAHALKSVERKHTQKLGIHVDIFPVHRLRVRYLPPALTWYELGRGHRVLWGNPQSMLPLTRRKLSQVHPTEWGRLLVNRAAGVAFGRWVRRGQPCAVADGEDPDAFVTRQIQKAWLALGDVWLADRNAYHHLVCKRLARFESFGSQLPPWAESYRTAVAYKLAPQTILSPQEQDTEMDRLSKLYVPRLLGRRASPSRPAVSMLATLRHVPSAARNSLPLWAYPRERLRFALAAELAGDRQGLERFAASPSGFVHLWSRYG